MKAKNFAAAMAWLAVSAVGTAGTWAPGIVIDGNFDDWEGIPAVITDPIGDVSSGRDVKAIYMANDTQYLYVRIESDNSEAYAWSEYLGIDGDNSTASGYNLFGLGIGSDLLVSGASMFSQTTTSFNSGDANPNLLPAFGPYSASTNVELKIPLSTALPNGDITQAFPGGLGSTIRFLYFSAAGEETPIGTYTLEPNPGTTPPATNTIADFSAYDTDSKMTFWMHDSSWGGSSVARYRVDGPSGPSDHALGTTHTLSATLWSLSAVAKRFPVPINISGNPYISVKVFGDPAAVNKNLWLGLKDLDGTYMAYVVPFPTTAAWTNVDKTVPAVTDWYVQTAGSVPGLDLSNIVEWEIGMQNTDTNVGGTFAARYDDLMATPTQLPVSLSLYELE